MESLRFVLPQSEIPTHWYNVVADMPNAPLPPRGPDGNPATPEQMSAIFPMAILEQEMSAERWIPIPQEVREVYRLWRPSPLVRAIRLEQMLGTPAKIYYKNEGVPLRRRITTSRPGSSGLLPRPVPVSGAVRWRWPGRCSDSKYAFIWSRSVMARSRIVAR